MVSIRTGFWVAGTILLAGCATANVKPRDLSALGSAPTADQVAKITHGSPLYRLDYLAGDHSFIYETYEESGTERYYGFLFQDGKLAAVDLTYEGEAQRPSLVACTLFPASVDMDVDACFQSFNRSVEAKSIEAGAAVIPDKPFKPSDPEGTAGTVVEGAVVLTFSAPFIIPAAVIGLPIVAAASVTGDGRGQAPLDVKLGTSYEDIRTRVEQYPDKDRSIKDGSGTVLIPGSALAGITAAFGMDKGKVIWINPTPSTVCGGGMWFWGQTCTMGNQPRPPVRTFLQPTRARTAPVIDEWENLALYYSPPAHYDVIGRVSGKTSGFTAKGRMAEAIEGMKRSAREEGATGVLVDTQADPLSQGLTAAPPAGTGSPVYAVGGTLPASFGDAYGYAIYVPADLEAFQKAAQVHATTCDALSQKKDDAKDAYKALKGSGTPADIDAAKAKLQAAEDASDAAYCGDDPWYAEQMTAQKQ